MRPSQPAMVDRLVHHAEVMSLQARPVDDNDNDSISQTPRGAQGCRVIGAALEVRAEAVGLAVVYSMPTPIISPLLRTREHQWTSMAVRTRKGSRRGHPFDHAL